MDVVQALARLDGVARAAELLGEGVTRHAIATAHRAGSIRRVRDGVFVLPTTSPEVVVAAGVGGKVAGITVLSGLGVWIAPGAAAKTHVWVSPGAHPGRVPKDAVLHWDRGWSGDGRTHVSVLHALYQVGRTMPVDTFLVALESALNKQLIRPDELDELTERLTGEAVDVVAFARASAQSGLESIARWRLSRAGFAATPQHVIPRIGVADLVLGTSLLLEFDGASTHDFESDRRRDAATAALNYVTLRFSYEQVLNDWPAVLAAVRAFVELGLHELPIREVAV